MMACAFPQCLLRACCMPERAGNSNEQSDQGFLESHKFYRKGSGDRCISGSWFQGCGPCEFGSSWTCHGTRGAVGLCARAALVLAGAPPSWTPVPGLAYTWVPARPPGSHPDVTPSFHIRPRPRTARRAGASVAEPKPRCCAPEAAHRVLAVWLSPTLLARELPTRGGGTGSTDLGSCPHVWGLLRSRERSRRPHPAWGREPGGWGTPRG